MFVPALKTFLRRRSADQNVEFQIFEKLKGAQTISLAIWRLLANESQHCVNPAGSRAKGLLSLANSLQTIWDFDTVDVLST